MKKSFNKKIALLIGVVASAPALADGLRLGIGMDYSTGKYGSSESTNVLYVPFSAQYETGALTYSVTVPWIRVTGNGSVIPGGLGSASGGGGAGTFGCAADARRGASKPEDNGPCAGVAGTVAAGTSTAPRTTESGLGDVIAGVTYNVMDNKDSGWLVDVVGRIKFATADENKALGSGKNDYAIHAAIEKSFGAPFVSMSLGYKWLGEPAGVSYKNVVFGSVGAGYKFSDDVSVGLTYDTATASVDGGIRSREVTLDGSYRINDRYKVSAVIYGGLTDADPDRGGGVYVKYYW